MSQTPTLLPTINPIQIPSTNSDSPITPILRDGPDMHVNEANEAGNAEAGEVLGEDVLTHENGESEAADRFSPNVQITTLNGGQVTLVTMPDADDTNDAHHSMDEDLSSNSHLQSVDSLLDETISPPSPSIIRRRVSEAPTEDIMPNYLKYATQDVTSAAWKRHSKHVFIMSKAGKPIFTRYGDEADLNTLMGFFAVLIDSVNQDGNDTIQYLEYDTFKVVFKLRDAIILIAMCTTLPDKHTSSHALQFQSQLLSTSSNSRYSMETPQELESQLDAIYNQIEFFVTSHLQRKLQSEQNFDVRKVLGGTDAILHNLISAMSRTLHFSWQSYRTLRMKSRTRSQVADLMMRYKPDDLCYGLLLSRGQLVHILRSKKWALHASDLLLLLNFVKSNSSLKNSDTWTPVCLPKVKNNGYLFAYITFIDVQADLCLMYICSGSERFPQCASAKKKLMKVLLQDTKLYNDLITACNAPRFSVTELKLFPSLRHFVFFNHSCNQLADARYTLPYNQRDQQKRLIREYKQIRETLLTQGSSSHPVYFRITDHETIIAFQTPKYELYATFSLLVSKEKAVLYCEEIEKYVKKYEDSLFLTVATC